MKGAGSQEITIRRAGFSDMDDLVSLLKELFAIEADFDFDETAQRRGLGMMLTDTNSCVLVAEKPPETVGMCTVQILISTAEGGKAGVVEDMVVGKHHRRNGAGSLLLASAEKWAREKGISRLQLLADRNNAPGLAFYRKTMWTRTDLICLRKRSF